MDFIQLSKSRQSVRSYNGQDISNEDIQKMLLCAINAPSAGNCQPWRFHIIRETNVTNALCEKAHASAFIKTAPAVILVSIDYTEVTAKYGNRGRDLYAIQDTAAAVMNILLCAESLGIGACWCGAFDENAVIKILNLGALRPVAIISLGYALVKPPKVSRIPLESLVSYISVDGTSSAENKTHNVPALEHAYLPNMHFNDLNLESSEFGNINLHGAKFSDVNLDESYFNEPITLAGAEFHGANMPKSEFHGCDLSGAKFINCDLFGAIFEDCKGVNNDK
jgi:nitroreductase